MELRGGNACIQYGAWNLSSSVSFQARFIWLYCQQSSNSYGSLDSNNFIFSGNKPVVLKYSYMGKKTGKREIYLLLYLRKQFFLWSVLKKAKSNLKNKPLVSIYLVEIFKSTSWFKVCGPLKAKEVCASGLLKHIWYACLYWILYIGFTGSIAWVEAKLWYIIPPGLKCQLPT